MHTLVPPFIQEKFEQHQAEGCFAASTLLVDIVGFTVITETLMQHGQHGAEVLASSIRSLFTPLMQGDGWQVLGRVAARLGAQVNLAGQLHDAETCFDKSAAIFKQAGMESDYAWTQHYRAEATVE